MCLIFLCFFQQFVSERKYEEELANTVRFKFEANPVMKLLKEFGEVVAIKEFPHRHHSGSSSMYSSNGTDSAIGMASPSSPGNFEINFIQQEK